jgi:type II secretory pathway predicted ATPase ExeA
MNQQRSRPFRATPDTRYYFPHSSIHSARETAIRAIVRGEGPVMVLGGAGYGKSLLADLVAEELDDRLEIVKLQSARLCSRRALLQNILFELGLPFRELSEGELRLSILDHLEPSPETAPEGILIVVDEAQTLHWKLLEELRLISNYTRNNQPRVRLLLLGNLRLEEIFTAPQLESFSQRLAARCYLQPMNCQETTEFIKHQLRQAGESPEALIQQEAIQVVHSACEGIPRLVNQLMDHVLVLAQYRKQPRLDIDLINEAWADLQQLPAPWTSKELRIESQPAANTVEFGSLDENELEESEVEPNRLSDTLADFPTNSPIADRELETRQQDIADDEWIEFPGPVTDWQPPSEELPEIDLAQELQAETSSCSIEPCERDEEAGASAAEIPSNFFSAFTPEDEQRMRELVDESTDSEREKVECLQEELQQYDDLGLWEEDPPLLNRIDVEFPVAEHSTDEATDCTISSSNAVELSTEELFGGDFDQEIRLTCLSNTENDLDGDRSEYSPVNLFSAEFALDESRNQSLPALNEIHACEVSEEDQYLERLERCADVLTDLSGCNDQVWSVDTTAGSVSQDAMEASIADVVSQLNFSAFLVEPFSVEQIPLQAQPNSIPEDRPEDSIRFSGQDQFHAMHRPVESIAVTSDESLADDDRDILIIEEDIPVASRLLDQSLTDEPIQKPLPYAQLFAKLRK